MVSFPNCKINLGLNITRKREDGYHDLETVFYPLAIADVLEIIAAEKSITQNEIDFSCTGLSVDGDPENNLCLKAYRLLKKNFPQIPAIKMHLHKAIPMGAGLGGGSADAAFTLILLNNKFNLNLSTDQLINFALQLGSDCPFFINNRPCFATGRGEVMEEVGLNLSSYKIAIVNPGIHINTSWAFSQITPVQPTISIRDIIQQPIIKWKDLLHNDFEQPVLAHYPKLKQLKEQLYTAGAVYAAMSGSGSSFYGIFGKEVEIKSIAFPPHYFVKIVD